MLEVDNRRIGISLIGSFFFRVDDLRDISYSFSMPRQDSLFHCRSRGYCVSYLKPLEEEGFVCIEVEKK